MKLIRLKNSKGAVLGVLKGDRNDTYYTVENAEKLIPCGRYSIKDTWSPRFNRTLPLVVGVDDNTASVKDTRGIRVHAGNSKDDSAGCLIVGNRSDLCKMTVEDSRTALEQFVAMHGPELTIVDMTGL